MARGSTEKSTNKTDCIGDLLHWLNVIARDEFVIGIEKLYTSLLEHTLGQEQTFDMWQAWTNKRTKSIAIKDGSLHSCGLL